MTINNCTKTGIRLSIIIPCHNSEGSIVALIYDIARQVTDSVEVIIVDDASADNTFAVVKKACAECNLPRYQILALDSNLGAGGARNIGIRNSSGEYLTFIDSDDWIAKNYVAVIESALLKNSDVDVVYFDHSRVSDSRIIPMMTAPRCEYGLVSPRIYLFRLMEQRGVNVTRSQ